MSAQISSSRRSFSETAHRLTRNLRRAAKPLLIAVPVAALAAFVVSVGDTLDKEVKKGALNAALASGDDGFTFNENDYRVICTGPGQANAAKITFVNGKEVPSEQFLREPVRAIRCNSPQPQP